MKPLLAAIVFCVTMMSCHKDVATPSNVIKVTPYDQKGVWYFKFDVSPRIDTTVTIGLDFKNGDHYIYLIDATYKQINGSVVLETSVKTNGQSLEFCRIDYVECADAKLSFKVQ